MKKWCLCLVLASLWACDDNESGNCNKAEFKIANMIASTTKAPQLNDDGGGSFVDGDTVALFFQTTQQTECREYSYVYGGQHYWGDLGLPESVGTLKLSGCYPNIQTDAPEAYAWNVKERGEKSDLLLAAMIDVQQGSSDIIPLRFSHAMHKLAVELIPDGTSVTQEMMADAVITCRQVLPVAKVNLLTGTVLGAEGELTDLSLEGTKGAFIVPAQAVGAIEIGIKVDSRNFTYKLSGCQVEGQPLTQLLTNHTLSIKIKVSKGAFEVVGESINGWGVQGEINDSIII